MANELELMENQTEESCIEKLIDLDPSAPGFKELGDLTVKLMHERNEREKSAEDAAFKEKELKLKEQAQKDDKLMKGIGYGVTGFVAVAGLAFRGYWMAKGYNLEMTGSFTNSLTKGLFGRLIRD